MATFFFSAWADAATPTRFTERQPTLPETASCPEGYGLIQLSDDSDWEESEIWAWEQICVGKIANFAKWKHKPCTCPPENTTNSPAPVISSKFLKTILGYRPFVDLITQEGVLIECALFREQLNLSEIRTPHRLWLDLSQFNHGMEAINFRTDSELTFDRAHFSDSLILDRSRIGGTLWLVGSKFTIPASSQNCASTPRPCAIQTLNVEVGENFTLTGANVEGNINAGGMRITGDLILRGGSYGKVILNGAQIGGDVSMCKDPHSCSKGSAVEHLSLEGASVRGSVLFNGSTFSGGGVGRNEGLSLDLTAASINNHLELQDVTIEQALKATGVRVDGNALVRGNNEFGAANFVGGRFGRSLDLRGSKFGGLLDLSNARVNNTLILHTPDSPYRAPVWNSGDAGLSLQNAEVGSLQDWGAAKERFIYGNLKERINLTNFVYGQFGLIGSSIVSNDSIRDLDRLTGEERVTSWLALQAGFAERALPQPFEQLANTLERTGYVDEARSVRVASRNQALRANETSLAEKILLFTQWIIIGYGYNTWISLLWLGGLIVLGALVGRYGRDLSKRRFVERLWFSLDAAIPLLELNARHKDIDVTGARGYFYFHRIIGFLLASFLIAGLSGLTK